MRHKYLMFSAFVAIFALTAMGSPAREATAEVAAQRQLQLASVQVMLSQLKNEQAINQAAMNGNRLPPNVMAGLEARAKQLNAEIKALLNQERALKH
jgi:methyl coenzyme M reductase subunit D